MRFRNPKSTLDAIWICLLAVCTGSAGCAIEPGDERVALDAGYPEWAPEPSLFGGPVHEEEPSSATQPEAKVMLRGAAPNPIDTQTRLSFAVHEEGERVVLAIYAIDGRRVRLLVDELLEQGEYSAFWYARDDAGHTVPSGVYLVTLRRGGEVVRKKVLLVQ